MVDISDLARSELKLVLVEIKKMTEATKTWSKYIEFENY
jgi:hypothetical protein